MRDYLTSGRFQPSTSDTLNIPVSVQSRQAWHIPFIEVGLGVEQVSNSLMGILRVTASTYEQPQHVWGRQRIPFGDDVVRRRRSPGSVCERAARGEALMPCGSRS